MTRPVPHSDLHLRRQWHRAALAVEIRWAAPMPAVRGVTMTARAGAIRRWSVWAWGRPTTTEALTPRGRIKR